MKPCWALCLRQFVCLPPRLCRLDVANSMEEATLPRSIPFPSLTKQQLQTASLMEFEDRRIADVDTFMAFINDYSNQEELGGYLQNLSKKGKK